MKNGYIKTAAATPYITVADCNANGNEIIRLIHEMEKEHVKVMTFPELCITGYTCQDLFLQRRLLDSAWETLLKITKETADVDALVFVGVPFRNHGKLYNVAAVLNRGEIIGLVPKTYLPNYGEFYEQRHFASGLGCLEYVDIEGKRVPFGTDILFICEEEPELVAAAEICEDVWVPCPPSIRHALAGLGSVTKLIIAQRITSVQNADLIVILDDGRLHAVGTHDELLAKDTIYQEIYHSQMKGGDADGESIRR